MRIGVDLMGSESSPEILFEALLEVYKQANSPAHFLVFTTNDILAKILSKYPSETFRNSYLDFCLVSEFISMEDDPLTAIRMKRDSSLLVGIKHLGEQKINAFVTAGNTGALIAAAAIFLNPLGSFDRTALLAVLPTKKKPLVVIDVGGTVSYKAHHLILYAHIGAAYQRCTFGIEKPKIGLLNIGVESKKGTPELREAYRILQKRALLPEATIAFAGNVEGREIFSGEVDVLVTDGFTGNVFLKTSEGTSFFIFDTINQAMQGESSAHLDEALKDLYSHFNYEEYSGALVCGVEGIVIKCHGTATKKAMKNSILGAIALVQNDLIRKMHLEIDAVR